MSSTTLLIPPEGKFVKFAPDTAGKTAGNLASGTVPELKLLAFIPSTDTVSYTHLTLPTTPYV